MKEHSISVTNKNSVSASHSTTPVTLSHTLPTPTTVEPSSPYPNNESVEEGSSSVSPAILATLLVPVAVTLILVLIVTVLACKMRKSKKTKGKDSIVNPNYGTSL